VVQALQALRGVELVTAVGLVAEIGDLRRFEHPRKLMGYVGLVPSEASSGDRVRRRNITKTGNAHARRLLTEAAWHYRFKARIGTHAHRRQQGLSQPVRDIAWPLGRNQPLHGCEVRVARQADVRRGKRLQPARRRAVASQSEWPPAARSRRAGAQRPAAPAGGACRPACAACARVTDDPTDPEPDRSGSSYTPWARLLGRVFKLDLKLCPNCGGKLRIIAAIVEREVIERILEHLKLPARAPPRTPVLRDTGTGQEEFALAA
jgi:hypothetical protein